MAVPGCVNTSVKRCPHRAQSVIIRLDETRPIKQICETKLQTFFVTLLLSASLASQGVQLSGAAAEQTYPPHPNVVDVPRPPCAAKNPVATALQFYANNSGAVRDCRSSRAKAVAWWVSTSRIAT